jgi:hypothetical protein
MRRYHCIALGGRRARLPFDLALRRRLEELARFVALLTLLPQEVGPRVDLGSSLRTLMYRPFLSSGVLIFVSLTYSTTLRRSTRRHSQGTDPSTNFHAVQRASNRCMLTGFLACTGLGESRVADRHPRHRSLERQPKIVVRDCQRKQPMLCDCTPPLVQRSGRQAQLSPRGGRRAPRQRE